MEPASVERVLGRYLTEDLCAGYAPPGESATQPGDLHFQLRKINGKEIVIVRFGKTDTLVFKAFERLDDISAYLGEPPTEAIRR